MSELRFRPATRADDAFFRRMEFETTWQSLDAEDQARLKPNEVGEALEETLEILLARPGNQVVVAEDEQGERVGLLWFGVNRNLVSGEDEAWIYNISVVPEMRSRGVGQKLMEEAERLAQTGGFQRVGLMVSAHNTRARSFYERLGFRETNVLLRKPVDPAE